MAGKVLNKMMGLLGLEDDLDEDIEETEERVEQKKVANDNSYSEPIMSSSKKQNKVVSIHTTISAKVRIVKPTTYEEAADICDELKNRKIIVINTTAMETRTAQRLLDFMGGASYALAGDLEEVEKGVYILSPSTVEVSNDFKNELSTKGIFGWNK